MPRHLVVVGGSYVGLEFAQMYRRFGAEVTVVEMGPRLIGREDEDVSDAMRDILEAEGITVPARRRVHPPGAGTTSGVAVRSRLHDGPPRRSGSHVLLAVGRQPNTDDLGLDHAGVATDERGYIKVDDGLRTNVPGIWALGDCNGRGAFTHTAYNDFEIVAANLLDGEARRGERPHSGVCAVHRSAARPRRHDRGARRARAAGRCSIGKRPMTRVSRAVEKGETQGS